MNPTVSVRVADQTCGEVRIAPLAHFAGLAGLHFGEFALQRQQPLLHEPAVQFDLLLAGTARSDAHRCAARHLTKMRPHRAEPWRRVLELSDLDLELRLLRRGAMCEDVEDQLAAIDDLDRGAFARDFLFERLDLARRKLVVENDQRRLQRLRHLRQLFDLPLAEVGSSPRLLAVLHEFAHCPDAGRLGQRPQFGERIFVIRERARQAHADQDRRLRPQVHVFARIDIHRGGDCRAHRRVRWTMNVRMIRVADAAERSSS